MIYFRFLRWWIHGNNTLVTHFYYFSEWYQTDDLFVTQTSFPELDNINHRLISDRVSPAESVYNDRSSLKRFPMA